MRPCEDSRSPLGCTGQPGQLLYGLHELRRALGCRAVGLSGGNAASVGSSAFSEGGQSGGDAASAVSVAATSVACVPCCSLFVRPGRLIRVSFLGTCLVLSECRLGPGLRPSPIPRRRRRWTTQLVNCAAASGVVGEVLVAATRPLDGCHERVGRSSAGLLAGGRLASSADGAMAQWSTERTCTRVKSASSMYARRADGPDRGVTLRAMRQQHPLELAPVHLG